MATLTCRPILCPVDFSDTSRQALRWAAMIAQRRGGELTVLSVVEPLLAHAAGLRLHVDLAQADVEPALRAFVAATLPDGARKPAHVRVEVTVGETSAAILQRARMLDPGLIAMGTHGLGGVRKLILGSTTEQILRRTEWPVLAVPPGAGDAPDVEHPGVQLKKILLATDFRESASSATQWAADLARDLASRAVLAHVVEPVLMSPLWEPLVAEHDDERVASGRRMLSRVSASFAASHADCVLSVGQPAHTLAALAVEYGAGLIVMGLADAHDSELRKPGAIAYHVLRTARIPVVVVPRAPRPAALDMQTTTIDLPALSLHVNDPQLTRLRGTLTDLTRRLTPGDECAWSDSRGRTAPPHAREPE